MNILNFSKKLFSLPLKHFELRNVRIVSSASKKNKNNESIAMSYASYESTESLSGEKVPPIIVMHGLFGSKGNWNSICKAIHSRSNPQRKIIAADARNHGDSPHIKSHTYDNMATDIKRLMKTQNISKTCLLGHSMGGKTVMYFALKYPELVEKLIVVDISPFSHKDRVGDLFHFFTYMNNVQFQNNISLSQARKHADTELGKHIRCKGVRAFLLTNLVKKSDGSYAWRLNIPVLTAYYQKIADFPSTEGLTYKGKTLLIYGGASDFIQKSDLKDIRGIFPNIKLQVIDGAGHWLHSENPVEFVNYVLEFLNQN